jgi:serine-aspartate repeat-containing protein C/D/E
MPQLAITFKITNPYYTDYGPGELPDGNGFTAAELATFSYERSMFDVLVKSETPSSATFIVNQWYDAWCIDPIPNIYIPDSNDVPYTHSATYYSTYELGLLPSTLASPNVPAAFQQNLDVVNWVLNQDYSTRGDLSFNDGVNYGEIQGAIWTLLGYANNLWDPAYRPFMEKDGVVSLADVQTIVNDALAHDGFVPDAGQTLGVVLETKYGTLREQPLIIEVKAAKLGDRVWHDLDADGIQDTGESGISGVVVKLVRDLNNDGDFDDTNEVLATTTTADGTGVNPLGYYEFKGLTPGLDYQVQFFTPAGYDGVSPRQSDSNPASGSNSDGLVSDVVVLAPGEFNQTLDSGFYKNVSVGNFVWNDADIDGIQDAGEAGIGGVTLTLTGTAGSGQPVLLHTTTAADGSYQFANLIPGTYQVTVDVGNFAPSGALEGFNSSPVGQGSDPALDSNASPTGTTPVLLESGNDDQTLDFGYNKPATPARIGDFVWEDKDADGVQDANEAGIQGITVNLKDSNGNIVATQQTGANGEYLFTVDPGTYSVSVNTAGWFVSPQDQGGNDAKDSDINGAGDMVQTVLSPDETDLTWDAGLYKKAAIGDKVWYDTDKDGIQDAGEAGVEGVRANLVNSAGSIVATQLTNASGEYLFTGLTPGDYRVDFDLTTLPAGYVVTTKDAAGSTDANDSDANVTTGQTTYTNLESGETDRSWDMGIQAQAKASIGDRVWLDCDADGIQDANEIGVSGVMVHLLSSTGAVLGTTNTDYQGNYLFSNLTPGDYAVQVVKPNGYSFTAKDQGGNDALDSDADTTNGKMVITTLSAGENDMSWDAGLTTVGACLDLDLTGGANSGSSAGNIRSFTMNGLSVHASAFSRTDSGGNWATAYLASYSGGLGVTDTSEDGSTPNHAIDNVGGRDNYILFEFNKTVLLDKAFLGWVSGDSDVQVWIGNFNNPYNSHLTLSDSVLTSMGFMEVNTTTLSTTRWADLNAGDFAGNTIVIAADTTDISPEDYFKLQTLSICTPACGLTASIGDKVWLDSDCDGVQDTGEAGVAGVTVRLLNTAGAVLSTTTTDASGNYLFSNLAPGDYAIQVVAPTGYAFTGKDLGGNDATDSDVDTSTGKTIVTTLSGGENDMTWDAGLKLVPTKASIGNKVWHDLDYDGIQDSGEAGIASVTVKLLNSAGTVVATTTTNSVGEYLFSNLTPGDYKVQVVKPSGYYITKQDQGSNNNVDSDVNSSGITALTNLVAGENDLSWDAGLYKKASIGDKVWEDKDHDDIQDSTEPGIGNVKVSLQNSSGTTIQTAYTDSNGNYKFINLDPGVYRLQFDKTNTVYQGISMKNWMWASKDIGSNDSIDSDVTGDGVSKTNITYTGYTTLTSGENDMTWDAAITPIVIDLNGDGIHTISRANSNGTFDLLGSGTAINSGWLSGDDGFLAVDANGNGKIDSIAELFGGLGKGDGFAKLASFDSNGDGVVNAADADFASLKIWQDVNGNHQTDAGELLSLAEAGVTSLAVGYTEVPFVDAQGNLHLERSSATLADGSSVDMTDVYFNVAAEDAAAAGVDVANLGQLLGDDSGLDGLLAGLGGGVGMAISATVDVPANADVFDTAGLDGLKQMAALYEEQAAACCA